MAARGRLVDDGLGSQLDRIDAQILSPSVRAGFRYWRDLLRGRNMPARTELDPTAIGRLLVHICLIDVQHDPLDFHVRLVGEHVSQRQGATRGRRLADCVAPEQGRDVLLDRLRECIEQRLPAHRLYRYVPLVLPRESRWVEGVSCPLSDSGDGVDCIVNFGSDDDFAVPENSAGQS